MGTLRRIGGTWSAYDVPGLVTLLSHEDPNAISEQLGGWWRAETTLTEYRRRLEACRDALAQKWPPEHSEAAAAFVQQVNATIGELNSAVSAIGRNAGALSQTDNILSLAKHELDAINVEWQGYTTREQDAEIEAQTLTLGEVKPTGLDPEWREQLNQRARAVMSNVERDLAASAERMVETPGPSHIDGATPWAPGGGSADGAGSSIDAGKVSAAKRPEGAVLKRPYIPLPDDRSSVTNGVNLVGPQLASSAPSDLPIANGTVADPPRTGPGPNGGGPANPWQGQMMPGGGRSMTDGTSLRSSPSGFRATSELGAGERRISPVGGVISGDRTAATHGGVLGPEREGNQGMMAGGVGSGRPHGSGRLRRASPGQRTDEWHVAVGGPAVLEPQPESRHDPGPGVIGVDR